MSTHDLLSGTATQEKTTVHAASHRSYVVDKLSKKQLAPPKISPTKVEKPTQLYRHANFHANRHKIVSSDKKYTFFLIGASLGATVHVIHFEELSSSQVTPHFTCNAATYHFSRRSRSQFGILGTHGDTLPNSRDFVSGTHIYHHAQFRANQFHHQCDI